MELGEKLRTARQEAGLSQRQLCGDIITRNMLSLIEHGNAKPSMDTLKLLAARLGKPMSYFLEEDAVVSLNAQVMETVRERFDAGDFAGAAAVLEDYREGDCVYDREATVLRKCIYLELAEQAIREKRRLYALELLEKAETAAVYCNEALERRRLLLVGQVSGERVSDGLPSLDGELMLRAGEALRGGDTVRARRLLEAAEDQGGTQWNFLMGLVRLEGKKYREAARCFLRAESAYPRETAPLLEQCYRELGDYRKAYEYAVRQK